ncbi:MAG: hemerythrin domain-containing protein [Bacteroidetes bacterium]|nr:hemerythrin domain-containing protein [Bacteroidota bacterium]
MKITKNGELVNYNLLSLDELVGYVSETYHGYLKKLINSLESNIGAMLKLDANQQSGLASIRNSVLDLKIVLEQHVSREEATLFPFISNLTKNNKYVNLQPEISSVNLINKIKKEHIKISEILNKIRKLSHNYAPPTNSTSALKLCYAQLFNLEQDIHKHVFLEENILFPKVLDFEKRKIRGAKK